MSDHAFSAEVALTLVIDGREIALSHVAPEYFVVQDDCGVVPASEAELVVQIDDYSKRTPISLASSIQGKGDRVKYRSLVRA